MLMTIVSHSRAARCLCAVGVSFSFDRSLFHSLYPWHFFFRVALFSLSDNNMILFIVYWIVTTNTYCI